MRLDQKIAIVTGGGSGFGEGIAKRFAEEGCKVMVADINDEGGNRVVAEIVAAGFPEAEVLRVARLVDRNEYKRRQAPPGVRITRRAFGRDRRYPITSGF